LRSLFRRESRNKRKISKSLNPSRNLRKIKWKHSWKWFPNGREKIADLKINPKIK
jgi:hypothetical protein